MNLPEAIFEFFLVIYPLEMQADVSFEL